MALTKSSAAITQLTASGTSTALDVSASYRSSLYLSHSNGTGTVTAAAAIQVQVKPAAGNGRWYNHGGALSGGTVAASVTSWDVELPDDAGSVQLVYTAPTGATGVTLDAEAGKVTAL